MKTENNISLKQYNTFKVDVRCSSFIHIEKREEISRLIQDKVFKRDFLIIGGGSNILFTRHFKGSVIQLHTKGIDVIKEDKESVWLRVAAGEEWDDLIRYAIQKEYYGIENLIGIPGFVGSSPIQNIGAYGVEVKDVIDSVEGYYVESGEPFSLNNAECAFGYRSSAFKTRLKKQCLITDVIFRLSKKEHFTIQYAGLADELRKQNVSPNLHSVSQTVLQIRNRKLPDLKELGSAGSFFKNPVISKKVLTHLLSNIPELIHYPHEGGEKLAAGQLIDLCGWKGKREGDVGVYPQQALVIVNYGNATGSEIVAFYKKIQVSVQDRFGIELEPEVNLC